MPSTAKESIKQLLPASLLKAVQKSHYWFWMMRHPAARAERQQTRRLKEEFRLRNQNAAPGEIILRPGVRFNTRPDTANHLSAFCWMDRGVHEMDGFLAETAGRKCLFDIGAFHGIFSLVFCAAGTRTAYGFEPSPEAFEALQENAALNPKFDIQPRRMAIGNSEGELEMRYDWQHLVAVTAAPGTPAAADSVLVPMTTTDAFCAANNVWPDTMKVDVEGFELQVLQGAAEAIRRARPLMYIEVHPRMLTGRGVTLAMLWELLRQYDYEILDIHRNPLLDPTPFALEGVFNIVCRPNPSAAAKEER